MSLLNNFNAALGCPSYPEKRNSWHLPLQRILICEQVKDRLFLLASNTISVILFAINFYYSCGSFLIIQVTAKESYLMFQKNFYI